MIACRPSHAARPPQAGPRPDERGCVGPEGRGNVVRQPGGDARPARTAITPRGAASNGYSMKSRAKTGRLGHDISLPVKLTSTDGCAARR
jgi:hypothetical protein